MTVDWTQRVIPDGHADLLVYDSGASHVVGLHDELALPVLPRGTVVRGIRLRPEAVAPMLEIDASSLRNLTVPVADVVGTRLARRLDDSRAVDAWIRSVEPHPRTSTAVRLLATHSVDDVADQLGISGRQLRRILLDDVGLGPKTFQRVVRLQRFLQVAEQGAGLARAAADAGYADQSHLTRQVRELSGLTPAQLLAERGLAA